MVFSYLLIISGATSTNLTILKSAFGTSPGNPGYDGRADFNGDNIISLADFSLLRINLGILGDLAKCP